MPIFNLFFFATHGCVHIVCNKPSFFQTCKETQDIGSLTKASDFVKAFVLGFQVEVSILVEGFGELCMF